MKRLIQIRLLFFLILFIFVANNARASSYGDGGGEDTGSILTSMKETKNSEEVCALEKTTEDRGDLIIEYNSIKVYANYCLLEEGSKYGDDITAKDETYLIRYVDDISKDSMILKGPYSRVLAKGKLCQITVGTDTVNVDITQPFPKYVDLRFTGVVPGCRFYRYSKHYTLSDRSYPTDFQINLAIPDDAPEFICKIINDLIRDDVAGYFSRYSGDEIKYPDITLYNLKNGDFNGLIRYYYRQFCSLYQREFKLGEEEYDDEGVKIYPLGAHYSYQVYIYPVWQNSDSSLITWKFYNYGNTGGAHGGESEYYLTFDNDTGRILGVNDFYSKSEFKKAVEVLTRQLNAYHGADADNYRFLADIELASVESTEINELIEGKRYPRPALTKQGIVFTYQTYEKGLFCDGVLHFAQPYKKDFKLN